jgi:hypothetical protein
MAGRWIGPAWVAVDDSQAKALFNLEEIRHLKGLYPRWIRIAKKHFRRRKLPPLLIYPNIQDTHRVALRRDIRNNQFFGCNMNVEDWDDTGNVRGFSGGN